MPAVKKKKHSQLKAKETPLVRMFKSDKTFLETLSAERSQTMPQVLHSIITKYKRQEFFDDLAGAYAELKTKTEDWEEEKREQSLYENALLDGMMD